MKKIGVLLLVAILPVCSLAATEIYTAKITYKIINKTTNVIAYQKSEAPPCEATEGSSGLSYFDAAPVLATFSTQVGQCMSDYSSSGLSFKVNALNCRSPAVKKVLVKNPARAEFLKL